MNRRRFMKLFGAAAAVGAVPAIAGADAALAYAEKQPVQVEEAMRRLVDSCEDLRRPFVEFAGQADATAFSAGKLDEAMRQIAQNFAIDFTPPRYILMNVERAREAAKLLGVKLEERRERALQSMEGSIFRAPGFGDIPIQLSNGCPRDTAFLVGRDPATLRDILGAGARQADRVSRSRELVVLEEGVDGMNQSLFDALHTPPTPYAPAFHEPGKKVR